MWFYNNVTREEFEKKKDLVEKIILELGAKEYEIDLQYDVKTTSYVENHKETYYSQRGVFSFKDEFFRVDEVLFNDKPYIVLECGTLQQLINNTMDDTNPFPYDLSDEEIRNEVKYSLGIEKSPIKNPNLPFEESPMKKRPSLKNIIIILLIILAVWGLYCFIHFAIAAAT